MISIVQSGQNIIVTGSSDTSDLNILMYSVAGSNVWHSGENRIADGAIPLPDLADGDYDVCVMNLIEISNILTLTQALGNILTDPNANWERWIYASIGQHFTNHKGVTKLYIEGQRRDMNKEESFIELRLDGPTYTQMSKRDWNIMVQVNVLVQCAKNNTDYHTIRKLTGLVTRIFTPCILVYRYGDGPGDDQTLLGALQRMDDLKNREAIQVSHFGQVAPAKELEQASVEAHYMMSLSV